MSRRIAAILDEPEQVVTKLLAELEAKNGWPSHDARFIAETIQKVRQKISDLGLDPNDTTAQELYHALMVKFEKHSRLFDIHFGAEDMDFDQKSERSSLLVSRMFHLPGQWALKNTAAKAVLRRQPPKHVMKQLGYRSIDSMLKREKPAEIFLGAKVLESASWQKSLNRLISKLDQTDFELRPIAVVALSSKKWDSEISGEAVITDYNTASTGIWPSEDLASASLLDLVLILSREITAGQKTHHQLSQLSGVLNWWVDMEHLAAELGGEHVSLNLHDISHTKLSGADFAGRELQHVRHHFWQELLSRYENRPPAEARFDESVRGEARKLAMKVPPPAYEFVEEIDG